MQFGNQLCGTRLFSRAAVLGEVGGQQERKHGRSGAPHVRCLPRHLVGHDVEDDVGVRIARDVVEQVDVDERLEAGGIEIALDEVARDDSGSGTGQASERQAVVVAQAA